MRVFVTGGAGYIGSVCVDDLVKHGHEVTVYDNLTTGFRDSVNPSAQLEVGCLGDRQKVFETVASTRPDAIIHFAALVRVDESMRSPETYFENNTVFAKNLLDASLEYGVGNFVFSSTAATYGTPQSIPLTEDHPQHPINPYGESKLMFEKMIQWYGDIHAINFVIFRYFNASGATEARGQKQKLMTHLIPNVLKVALGERKHCTIFGTDFKTPDGTGIRDYIHVSDLSSAHIRAIEMGARGIFNLGVGRGYSVMEIINACCQVTGVDIPYVVESRRDGDPGLVIADSGLARKKLGWEPQYSDLRHIIETSWKWLSRMNNESDTRPV